MQLRVYGAISQCRFNFEVIPYLNINMPKIKVDHVVSFSSEDPVHLANNILSGDTTKRWKCQTPGEKSASIVLQLEKASVISSIDVGNEQSAYIEVLVCRSSKNDDFKVLLVMSSFMTPLESRQSRNTNKFRMFTSEQLAEPERYEKWDRVKIVCTQPFNRHIQYGLSFITFHSPEERNSTSAVPISLGKFTLRPESPDNLSAGSLFARRKELTDSDTPLKAAAAIRVASSSSAVQNHSPKHRSKLNSPSISNHKHSDENTEPRSRNRDELLYSKDEEETNSKIDKIIEQKNAEKKEKKQKEEEHTKMKKKVATPKGDRNVSSKKVSKTLDTSASSSEPNKRKLDVSIASPNKKPKIKRTTKPFNQLLAGVTLVISGIQNPDRATLRSLALSMGAKYKPDWDSSCTHLICAFTNTPKFNQVRGKGKIITRDWLERCHSERKKLPWRRFALDKNDQGKEESEDEIWEKVDEPAISPGVHNIDSEGPDTEDEIERILIQQRSDEQKNGNPYLADTDEEDLKKRENKCVQKLPQYFSNKVFYVDRELSENERLLLLQYITAFDGILVDDPSDVVDYAVTSEEGTSVLKEICPEAECVKPDWVWECHNNKKLLEIDHFKL